MREEHGEGRPQNNVNFPRLPEGQFSRFYVDGFLNNARLAGADNVLTITFVQMAFNLRRTDREDVKLQEAGISSTAHLFIEQIWGKG